jgi:KUP system potassium uptake protein
VILLTLETTGLPHLEGRLPSFDRAPAARLRRHRRPRRIPRRPGRPAVLRLARSRGLDIDVENVSYYVSHVSLIPSGRAPMARWRKRLFTFLYQNSTAPARYFGLPLERVIEVGAYVEL